MTRGLALGITLGLGCALIAQEPASPAAMAQPATESSLVQRFLTHRVEPMVRYRATRRLEAENKRFNVKGWMEVATELTPENGFTWTVVDEGGSGYVRNKVLRKALEGEQDIKKNDSSKSALSEANYTFELASAAAATTSAADSDAVPLPSTESANPAELAKLLITPKRKDMLLIDGALLLNQADADLVQIEGRLSKTPSWWTKSVAVVRRYTRINGIRVPIATESTANIRIAGRSEFHMTYAYQMINGQEVTARTAPPR